ncbi:MAG: hypothetical protein ABJN69_02405 [Hellea sp.]
MSHQKHKFGHVLRYGTSQNVPKTPVMRYKFIIEISYEHRSRRISTHIVNQITD